MLIAGAGYIGLGLAAVLQAGGHRVTGLRRSPPAQANGPAWIAADVTVLRGVTIGDHSVVGTRSLVTTDLPPRTLAYGVPARAQRGLGDRSESR